MKCLGNIAFGLAGGLALNAAVLAQELSSTNNPLPNNPYAPIVVRNVFNLAPPPDPKAETEKDKEKGLPKIDATGIQSFPGCPPQVLYKTSGGGAPGQPAKDKFYCLAEGQMEDEIEVSHIDTANAIVSFMNHGVEQDIPLVAPSDTGGGGPASGGGGGGNPVKPFGGGINPATGGGPGGITHFAGRGQSRPQGQGAGNNANYNPGGPTGANAGLLFGAQGQQGRIYQPPAADQSMTPEEIALLVAAQKLKAQDEGNPAAKLFPPSPLDKEIGAGQ